MHFTDGTADRLIQRTQFGVGRQQGQVFFDCAGILPHGRTGLGIAGRNFLQPADRFGEQGQQLFEINFFLLTKGFRQREKMIGKVVCHDGCQVIPASGASSATVADMPGILHNILRVSSAWGLDASISMGMDSGAGSARRRVCNGYKTPVDADTFRSISLETAPAVCTTRPC